MMDDGILSFGGHHKTRAWFIRDERAGSARRLDGKLWHTKSKVLDTPGTSGLGAIGWPIGILRAKERQTVIVCEGGPDALASYAARVKLRGDFGIVCLLGDGLTIHESAIAYFTGKSVRFMAHANATGREFAERNARVLAGIATQVSIAILDDFLTVEGEAAIDLCDALAYRKPWGVPVDIEELFDFARTSARVRIIAVQPALFAASQSQEGRVTRDDSRITHGGHTRTQKMEGRNFTQDVQELHLKARELASTARGQSHKRLFALARAVLGFEAHTGSQVPRDSVFETWFFASKANLDPADTRPQYLARFRGMFRKVRKIPSKGHALIEAEQRARVSTMPDIPGATDFPNGWRFLAAVCRELQRLAGEAPFFIGTRDAARIATGTAHAEIGSRALQDLIEFGVIERVRRGDARPGGKASEFRYLLP